MLTRRGLVCADYDGSARKEEFNKNFLFVKMVGVETPLLFSWERR